MNISRFVIPVVALFSACSLGLAQRLPEGADPGKRGWYGEFYNLEAYRRCVEKTNDPRNRQCDYMRLTRIEEPEYWPYPDAPKPKLPDAPDPPVYRPGMTSKEYFDALCKAEAGEFIYKTVENVEGIYQIRPRRLVDLEELMDRYVMEDPYGYTNWEAKDPFRLFVDPPFRNFKFFETPDLNNGGKGEYIRYFREAPRNSAEFNKTTTLKSGYGFLWRGIKRPQDRELSIAGGELIVLDLKTGEILGIRRGFVRSGAARTRSGIQWESAAVCPRLRQKPASLDKWPSFTYGFVSKVLRPPH